MKETRPSLPAVAVKLLEVPSGCWTAIDRFAPGANPEPLSVTVPPWTTGLGESETDGFSAGGAGVCVVLVPVAVCDEGCVAEPVVDVVVLELDGVW